MQFILFFITFMKVLKGSPNFFTDWIINRLIEDFKHTPYLVTVLLD